MPKRIKARAPQDGREEERIRRLARSRLGPRDGVVRARMVALSWDGRRVPAIAAEVGCLSWPLHLSAKATPLADTRDGGHRAPGMPAPCPHLPHAAGMPQRRRGSAVGSPDAADPG